MALTFSIWNNILTMEHDFLSITMHSISQRQEETIHAKRVRCRRHFPFTYKEKYASM